MNSSASTPQPPDAVSDTKTQSNGSLHGATELDSPNAPKNAQSDPIFEGKEKARAILAASLQPAPNTTPNSHPTLNSPKPMDGASSLTPGRKRSRSGTRLSHDPPPANSQATNAPSPPPTTRDLLLDQYIDRDQIAASAHIDTLERTRTLARGQREELEYLSQWRRQQQAQAVRAPTHIIYPTQKRRPGNRRARELRLSRRDRSRQAEQIEELVPVRLDLELEKLRLRDTFTWNIHDRVTPVESFAETLVEDFRLPPESYRYFTEQVQMALQEQISDYHPHPFIFEEALDPHLPHTAYKNDEMRILVRLNITIGNHTLVDQFDWDINNPTNSPEAFAAGLSHDMALSGEFTTAIAHSIREQTQLFTKGLYVAGHPFDGRPIEDSDLRDNLLSSPLTSSFRSYQSAKEFAPVFYELNDADLERTELVFSREQRQQKRSVNRRGGPVLPDLKDRLKTWRTMVISSVIPGCAESVEQSGIYRVTRSSGRGRRPWKNNVDGAGGDDEDDLLASDSDGDNSDGESLVKSTTALGATGRTRGMRGAATAAQAAMRANLQRSATPELSGLGVHHHETRTLPRRLGGPPAMTAYDMDDNDVPSLVVRLKLPKEKYRHWLREYRRGGTAPAPASTPDRRTHHGSQGAIQRDAQQNVHDASQQIERVHDMTVRGSAMGHDGMGPPRMPSGTPVGIPPHGSPGPSVSVEGHPGGASHQGMQPPPVGMLAASAPGHGQDPAQRQTWGASPATGYR
ncbi:MAG: SWI/SNF chromatin-remodeling complex subunit [Chrysothrix sp. TS-e1954]|nr:MAG: SWI/SNF chromatin-remodeling complex subunit [Chrysothrix sp. TS-e1954]